MVYTLDDDKLSKYVKNQLVNFSPDELMITESKLRNIVSEPILRITNYFENVALHGYRKNNLVFFIILIRTTILYSYIIYRILHIEKMK
jgi:hypothetical protein